MVNGYLLSFLWKPLELGHPEKDKPDGIRRPPITMIAVLFFSSLFMPLLYLGVIQMSTKKMIYLIFFVETLQSIFNAPD